jgi:hypothetical protein
VGVHQRHYHHLPEHIPRPAYCSDCIFIWLVVLKSGPLLTKLQCCYSLFWLSCMHTLLQVFLRNRLSVSAFTCQFSIAFRGRGIARNFEYPSELHSQTISCLFSIHSYILLAYGEMLWQWTTWNDLELGKNVI